MNTLGGLGLADLHAALAAVEDKKAVLRVSVGIGYVNGVTPTELAEWYGLSRATVYDWLERLERLAEEPPAEALVDAGRPGRPAKLSEGERDRLSAILRQPPDTAGYDARAWTPKLVKRHVETVFEVEYTRRHVRDLLHDLGFSPSTDGGWRRRG